MFDQNTSVVIKATKYELDIFASQVARNHAIAVYILMRTITGSPISGCTCCHHNISYIMMTACAAAYRATCGTMGNKVFRIRKEI